MKTQTAKQPNVIQQAHIDYLDALRASGISNMFNAWQFLKEEPQRLTAIFLLMQQEGEQ